MDIEGTDGNDSLSGGYLADWIRGLAGNDTLIGGAGNDLLRGGAGADILRDDEGDDTLSGGTGADVLNAGAGADVLEGGAGADWIFVRAGAGPDTIDGGAGIDRLDLRWSESTSGVWLSAGATQKGDVVLGDGTVVRGIEQLWAFGSDGGDDRLAGGRLADMLDGNAGNDTLRGGDGADTLQGGDGDDRVFAGDGGGFASGGNGDNTVRGGDGDDTLAGGSGADILAGGGGNDLMYAWEGTNRVFGGTGDDTLIAAGTDTIDGGDGLDTLLLDVSLAADAVRFSVADNLDHAVQLGTGSSIRNTERLSTAGSNHDDVFAGGALDDSLGGGGGSDTLSGGGGADAFAFDTALIADEFDLLVDFEPGVDQVVLADWIFTGVDAQPAGGIAAQQFLAAPGATAALDADHRLIYDTATGSLYYDADGVDGVAAVRFAVLGEDLHPLITAVDFALFGMDA